MADRMAVLKDGRVSQCGSPRELYERPQNRFTGSFLGDINFIDGKIVDGKLDTGFGIFPLCGDPDNAGCGAIRPERIKLVDASHPGAFAAKIVNGTFLGDCCEWICRVQDTELAVREYAPELRMTGDEVFLAFEDGFLMAME